MTYIIPRPVYVHCKVTNSYFRVLVLVGRYFCSIHLWMLSSTDRRINLNRIFFYIKKYFELLPVLEKFLGFVYLEKNIFMKNSINSDSIPLNVINFEFETFVHF